MLGSVLLQSVICLFDWTDNNNRLPVIEQISALMFTLVNFLLSAFQRCSTSGDFFFTSTNDIMQVDNSDVTVSVISRNLLLPWLSRPSSAKKCRDVHPVWGQQLLSVWNIPDTEIRDNLILTATEVTNTQKGWEKNLTCCFWWWVCCTGLKLKVRLLVSVN